MSLNTKVILSFLAATFAALVAWVVIDFNPWYRLSGQSSGQDFSTLFAQQAFVGVIFGLFVGAAIGFISGMSSGSSAVMQRETGWGALCGIGGGLLGLFFGQMFFGALYRDPRQPLPLEPLGPFVFIWDVFVRAFGWSLIGLFLGLAQGLPSKSVKTARHGAIGGFIGGILGGALFEIVPYVLPPVDNPSIFSRGIAIPVTGGTIGLFIGLVQTLMKQAWVRVVKGRNEGKEHIITKPRTTIGRDELSDVGLFGDRDIFPLHATIELRNGRHVLRDAGTQVGTRVNGQPVTEQVLRDGDTIEIASMRLQFFEKATASKVPKIVDSAPEPVKIPSMEGQCPFCGSKVDPRTGTCPCSIGAQPPGMPGTAPMPAPPPSPAASSGARLIGLAGVYAGQSFPLSPTGATSIGRESGRGIMLSMDTTVSRRHGRIENEAGTFVVYDEGSSNGTRVNGAQVSRQPLSPGDVIEFGSASFRFEL